MVVRGAPAIGIAAAYGVVLAARRRFTQDAESWRHALEDDLQVLAGSRRPAINLFWAIARMHLLANGRPGRIRYRPCWPRHRLSINATVRTIVAWATTVPADRRADRCDHPFATPVVSQQGMGHRLGRYPQCACPGQDRHRVCRRDAPLAAGCARLTAWGWRETVSRW